MLISLARPPDSELSRCSGWASGSRRAVHDDDPELAPRFALRPRPRLATGCAPLIGVPWPRCPSSLATPLVDDDADVPDSLEGDAKILVEERPRAMDDDDRAHPGPVLEIHLFRAMSAQAMAQSPSSSGRTTPIRAPHHEQTMNTEEFGGRANIVPVSDAWNCAGMARGGSVGSPEEVHQVSSDVQRAAG